MIFLTTMSIQEMNYKQDLKKNSTYKITNTEITLDIAVSVFAGVMSWFKPVENKDDF